jgi:tape measure domain-containing protein
MTEAERFFVIADMYGFEESLAREVVAMLLQRAGEGDGLLLKNTLIAFQQIMLRGEATKCEWLQIAEMLPLRVKAVAERLGYTESEYREYLKYGVDGKNFIDAVLDIFHRGLPKED